MINNMNDTMLLILSKYVEYSRFVQPACLPKFQSTTFPLRSTNVIAIGWVSILTEKRTNILKYISILTQGKLSYNGSVSSVLENVSLKVYDPSFCSAYSNFLYLEQSWTSQICCGIIKYFFMLISKFKLIILEGNIAGGKDTCEGDSGGGLYKLDKDITNNTIRVLVGLTGYIVESSEIF
jgi:hypothetical protein